MKKLILSAAMVTAFGVATSASAADTNIGSGTITFTGEVKGQTCTVHGGGTGQGSDFAVPLDAVQAGSLTLERSVAGTKPYQLVVGGDSAGCADGTRVHIAYDPNLGVTPEGYLRNRDTGDAAATKVALQLLDGGGQPINLATNPTSETKAVTGGSAAFNFYVQYVSLGGATPGSVNSAVQYSLAYD